MEVTRGVLESAPSAPPNSFFQQGQKHTISNFRGGILTGGAYAPPVLKQGGHMHTVPHGCARLWIPDPQANNKIAEMCSINTMLKLINWNLRMYHQAIKTIFRYLSNPKNTKFLNRNITIFRIVMKSTETKLNQQELSSTFLKNKLVII